MAHCLVMPLKGCHLSYVFWSFDCKLSEGGSTWLHIHAQMHVCVCVHLCPSMCAFLYLHTCMGLYVSRCMCIHVCESTHVCIHKLMSVCAHLCMCIFMQVCVYLHKCMCVLMCGIACAHIRAYQMLHVHAGEQMCLCVCICCFICFCVCLCMCSSVCAHTHICGKLLRTCTATYIYIYKHIPAHKIFSYVTHPGVTICSWWGIKIEEENGRVGSLWARCRPTTPWDNQMQSRQWRCIFKQQPSCEMLIFCFSQIPTTKSITHHMECIPVAHHLQ